MTNTPNVVVALFTRPLLPSIWPSILRVILGSLLIYHGASKVFDGGMSKMAESLSGRGWVMPELQAFAATYTEFAGGILLVVGLFTRPVAAANVFLFSVATFVIHADDPFARQEKALLFLVLAIYIFFVGPGKISVDNFLFKKTEVAEPDLVDEPSPSEPLTPKE